MKTLIQTNRILLTMLVLVTAMFMPAMVWAQDNQLALTLVSSDANSFENQGPDKLVYGQAGTALMWCSKQEDENGNFVPFHIIVKTDKRTMLKSYDLYEYSYIDAYENADWKDWAIYGTNDDPASATAQWTEVHKVTEAQLFNGAWGRKHTFTIDNNTSAYTYYKVQITAVVGKTKYESSKSEYIQMMGHMAFYGETPNLCDNGNHLFGELTAAKEPTCTEAGNIAYHQCKECEKYFDEEGHELAEGEWVRPAAGHTYNDYSVCTQCGYEKAYRLSPFTVKDFRGGFDNEGPDKAINTYTSDKWCGNFEQGNPYIVMEYEGRAKLDHYNLHTGNDILRDGNNRNPKEWKMYAKFDAGDPWTEISHVTDAQLPTTKSTKSDDYVIPENFQNTYYKFFKFEILSVEDGNIFEISEISMIGRPCYHRYADNICTVCGEEEVHQHNFVDGICAKCLEYEPANGDGTEASPYLISNAGQLAWYRDETSKGNRGSYVKLTADIDMSAVCGESIGSWKMIESNEGTFDGDGHVLKNLYIDDTKEDVGFIIRNTGVIKNLGIESGTVKGSGSTLGAICATNAKNENIVGQIINCFNKANVVSTYYGVVVPGIGGICGTNWGNIERCYNTGNVSGEKIIGGICGHMSKGTINNCYNTGNVHGKVSQIGGICGYIYNYTAVLPTSPSSITNCYNIGTITSEASEVRHTNPIVGNKESQSFSGKVTVNNNYYLGNCDSENNATGMTAEQFASGEVAWRLNGSIDNEGIWIAGKTDGTQAWYQKIGTDTYPVLKKQEGNTVYIECPDSYSNNGIGSHNLGKLIPAKEPSCTEVGNIAYQQCTDCKRYFDIDGNVLAEGAWVLPKTMHNFNADDICTMCGCKKPSILSFTVTESIGGYDGEGPDKAIDGITTNKWCGDIKNGNPYVVLKPECKAKLDHYYLYTGNDITYNGYNRNPKEWKLYAKENDVDAWTEISHVTDAQLPTTKSTQSDDYTIGEEFQDTNYKFFKFEIVKVGSGSIFEVGELCLIGNPCQHQYEGDSAICNICLEIKEHEHIYGEEPIVISEPTCVTTGTEAYVCSRCGRAKTQMTPWLGHDYDDYIVTKAPTCTATGEKEHTCKRCGYTDSEKIKPLGHTTIDDVCTVCGHDVRTDCIIEYTATEKLSIIMDGIEGEEGEVAFDYTEKLPPIKNATEFFYECEDWGEFLFGAHVIKHEYDEATHKGRIICDGPVWQFLNITGLRSERLTSITLPNTVEYIEVWAFEKCSGLTSVTLLSDDPQETHYDLDFYGCNNLQEIIVPYSAYEDYVKVHGGKYYYKYDEDGTKHKVVYKDLFKSLLSLDDTKAFETQTIEVKADATLQRSFANDGWYSLCVPFSVSVADSPFSQVAEFSELDGDTYRFTTVDAIEAGKAYIVKVDAAVSNPTFKNVFITTETPASYGDFIGVYSPTELGAGCKVIGSGTTVNPANPGTMKGFRAYFPASAAGAKAMRFTVDDGEATSIQSLTEAEGNKLKAEGAYNIAGQKVDENYRGIVMKNGKKYMNK